MGSLDLGNHVLLSISKEVEDLSAPLKKLGISYFTFDRVDKHGYRTVYSNRADWIHFYYKNSFFNHKNFSLSNLPSGFVFWSTLNALHKTDIYPAASRFGICHGITLVLQEDGFADFFHFGTQEDRAEMEKWFLYNLDLLKHFIRYFKSLATPLLNKFDQHKIFLPDSKDFELDPPHPNLNRQEFLHHTEITKFYINGTTYLTKRELDCLQYLVQGYTLKEIAYQLSLSPRTVEQYIEKVRKKMNCAHKSQLIRKLIEHGIVNYEKSIDF